MVRLVSKNRQTSDVQVFNVDSHGYGAIPKHHQWPQNSRWTLHNDEWWVMIQKYTRINWNALRPHTNGILLILAMIFLKLVSTVPTSAHVKSQTCARGEIYPAPRMWVRFSVKVNLLKHWTIIISILFGCNTVTSCDPYHFVRALVPRVAINHQSSILGTYMGCWATNPAMLGSTAVITQVSKAMKGMGGGKNLGFQETIHTGSLR